MIFISKKKFENEIARRVQKTMQMENIEMALRQQEEKIQKLGSRMRSLKDQIMILNEELTERKKGSIKGFYLDPDKNVTLYRGSSKIEVEKSTEPEG